MRGLAAAISVCLFASNVRASTPTPEPPPETLEYHDGEPIPVGYRVEERRGASLPMGLVAVGAGVAMFVAGSLSRNDDGDVGAPSTRGVLYGLGTIVTITGTICVLAGLPTHQVLVREESASRSPSYGATFALRF